MTVVDKKPILIHWNNRQCRHRLNLTFFRNRVKRALGRLPAERQRRLPDELGIILVSARESGRLHDTHLSDPSPADVLAFPHGEIVVCPEVAALHHKAHRLTFREELLTYILHGILHLAGYRDSTRTSALTMRRLQARLRR